MNYVFIAACILMIIKVGRRKLDFYSVGAICHILYNFHCVYGIVFISSHEVRNSYYYYSPIDTRVYIIVLVQMAIIYAAMMINDKKSKKLTPPFIVDNYADKTKERIYIIACGIAWIIMIYNIMRIGVSNLNAEKSYIWSQVSSLYVTSNWLGMAVFTYALKNKKYLLALFGAGPVLLHFFFGSRAYFAVLCIIVILVKSERIKNSFHKNFKIYILGAITLVFILAYKKMYTAIKAGNFFEAIQVLIDPDTYAYVLRLGEPRIVLANLNYIVTNNVKLGLGDLLDRIISIVPYLNNVIRPGKYVAVSTILRNDLSSTYGLASNIWGEFYALGSYFLLFVMFFLWIRMLGWGNKLITRRDWSSDFYMPLVAYFGFYIHRLDFVKAVGNAKMVVMAMILFLLAAIFVTRNFKIKLQRRGKGNREIRGN